ncbi:putative RING-like zinc finger [Lyophyllum shimeji]|uniref:RING-like zinc finger n=1 Tax=Lyophyllum shimeji TaxID=47721 RepID=A0A9P3PL31_LYOSH|nr:putative RING-like zinc finger [Lyophyllum shimeji]
MAPAHKASLFLLGLVLLLGFVHVRAYVPAQPTNSSEKAIAGGLNVTDISKLHLRWYSNGYYSQNVSYQLAGYNSSGISRGALVHFSEAKVSNETPATTTPWIAMVSCDYNATNASQDEDVFTLARDKGAVAALLYSSYSLACVINPEYADPDTFDQVFDIFSTQSLTSATLIEYQFGQFGPVNESLYGVYDSKRLNDSAATMNTTLRVGTPPAPGYLFAILQAYNASGQVDSPSGNTASTGGTASSKKQNTALAMIVLYAITGCVSALFCVVIISGAIRAIRHPERYGPRARNGRGGAGQSRAQGITRAILDTFPIVKFGGNSAAPEPARPQRQQRPVKDIEAQSDASTISPGMELKEWEVVRVDEGDTCQPRLSTATNHADNGNTQVTGAAGLGPQSPSQSHRHTQSQPVAPRQPPQSSDLQTTLGQGSSDPTEHARNDVMPASMGRDTCPICIMDFEEGDDLRILPCEGKHRFHQTCVDPWLLELSTSCPICREDFLALENILLAGDSEHGRDDHEQDGHQPHTESSSTPGNRFSRYLRFAKRRHRRRPELDVDPTDPYVPTAP